MRRKNPFIFVIILGFLFGSFSISSVLATDIDIKAADNKTISEKTLAELRAEIKTNGYTYTVDYNEATQYTLDQLCGFRPELAYIDADVMTLTRQTALRETEDLPSRYIGYYTSIKNQGSCGSCWAFAMAGTVEAQILRGLGSVVNISEQWLLDCNPWNWDCVGGNFNYWMFMSSGGIDESCYPYLGYVTPCNHSCPYLYFVYDWDWVLNGYSVAPVNLIKEAIVEHGSVSVGIYASTAFHYYSGGIFNNCTSTSPNHAVILCGWDDTLGCWLLKNSWGPTWGGVDINGNGKVDADERGFMWITYGCNNVGYGASFPIPYFGGMP